MKTKDKVSLVAMAAALVFGLACSRHKPEQVEPPMTSVEAEEMLTGVRIDYQRTVILLNSRRMSGVQVVPGTQRQMGSNYCVQVTFLVPNPTTSELTRLRGELTFMRHAYGRTRVEFRQLDSI